MNTMTLYAVHMCPGCDALTSDGTYCRRCNEEVVMFAALEEREHARRADALFRSLSRETGLMPEEARLRKLERWFQLTRRIAMIAAWAAVGVDAYILYQLFIH